MALRWGDFANMRRLMIASSLPNTFSGCDLDRYQVAWAKPGALSGMLGWYRAIFRNTLRRPAPRIGRITPPTLILWGEKDIALSIKVAEQSVSYLADGKLIRFPDATHWIHQDKSEEVTRHLLTHFTTPARDPTGF